MNKIFTTIVGLAIAYTGPIFAEHAHSYGSTRHCQVDYDHRPHTYKSGSHKHYCPGGAHMAHGNGGRIYGKKLYPSNYDPIVAQVQAALQARRFYNHTHHNQIDGIYGPETREAIENYQRSVNLPVTGLWDNALLESLNIAVPQHGAAPSNGQATAPIPVDLEEPKYEKDILTVDDAAALLQVTREDVIKILEDGELHGRKIGNAWRISRRAIEEYMKGDE